MNHFPSTDSRLRLRVLIVMIAIATIVGIVITLSACDTLFGADESTGPSESEQRQGAMRAQDILDGLLGDMVGPVLGLHGISVDPVSPREGSEKSWNVVFDNYSPPGEDFSVDGEIEIDVLTSSLLTVRAGTPDPLELNHHTDFSALSINEMEATWAEGAGPGDNGDPDTVTGTLTFTNSGGEVTHDAADLIDALDEGEEYEGDIPKEQVELAGGPMQVIGLVLQYFYMGPKHGLSVAVGLDSPWWATMTFSNFSPPGDDGQANGALRIEVPGELLFTVEVYTTTDIVITEPQRGTTTVSLDATATWADGSHPSDTPPESITGTITVNGVVYDIENLGRLPELFRTSHGDFEQHFKDFAWRPATEDPGAAWGRFSYLRFEIQLDGRSHTLFHHTGAYPPHGELLFQGPLMWDSGSPDSVWFGSVHGDIAYNFRVHDYTEAHLHLRAPWGNAGTREFLYSAGVNTLSGLVVDWNPAWIESAGYDYEYHNPMAGTAVELLLCSDFEVTGCSDPATLATTTTDARGYFEFTGLETLPNVFDDPVAVKVPDYEVIEIHFITPLGPRDHPELPLEAGGNYSAFVMVSEGPSDPEPPPDDGF